MQPFATILGLIRAGLRQVIGIARHRTAEPLLTRAWSYGGRTVLRFQRGMDAPPRHPA